MSYYLSSQSTIAREKFSLESWVKVLSLAMSYGWQPMGTSLSLTFELHDMEIEEWDGAYLTNDGQVVISEDALALAIALEKSLDDIPDFNIEIDPDTNSRKEDDPAEMVSPIEKAILEEGLEDHLLHLIEIHPFEYFAGEEKHHLVDFIRFCRLGSFTILRI